MALFCGVNLIYVAMRVLGPLSNLFCVFCSINVLVSEICIVIKALGFLSLNQISSIQQSFNRNKWNIRVLLLSDLDLSYGLNAWEVESECYCYRGVALSVPL